jgi:hypothetical protein
VDCGRALAAYMEAKTGNRQGRRVGFPRYKRKGRRHDSFRLRNKKAEGGSFSIRVGEGSPRSVILPGIGTLRVHDDTRRLRRLLRPVEQLDPMIGEPVVSPRARILFATVRRHGSRWYVCLNMQAPDLHPRRRHQPRSDMDRSGFVGVDRGLAAFAVVATADGTEIGRFHAPKPLVRRLERLRRRSRTCRAQSEALATGPRPPGGSPASMPVSPTCEEASFTRSPPSSPRPTAGWPSKISLSQTSSVTATVPVPSAMPPGRSLTAGSATRRPGWVAS